MPILMLDGWRLTKAQETSRTALKDEERVPFFLNTAHVVSAYPMRREEQAGFVVKDSTGDLHFLPLTPAEISQLIRMAVNEARPGV